MIPYIIERRRETGRAAMAPHGVRSAAAPGFLEREGTEIRAAGGRMTKTDRIKCFNLLKM